jgi:hypothetical protein
MLSDFLQPIFEVAAYPAGWFVVAVVSFGRWRCDPLLAKVPKQETRWGGLFHYRGRCIYFTSEGTALIGLVFMLIVICGWIVVRYGW